MLYVIIFEIKLFCFHYNKKHRRRWFENSLWDLLFYVYNINRLPNPILKNASKAPNVRKFLFIASFESKSPWFSRCFSRNIIYLGFIMGLSLFRPILSTSRVCRKFLPPDWSKTLATHSYSFFHFKDFPCACFLTSCLVEKNTSWSSLAFSRACFSCSSVSPSIRLAPDKSFPTIENC